jgi:predicted nucleotidyltransferase
MMRKTATLGALFPKVRQGVLAVTLARPERWWYLSELAGLLHTRPSSLQRELSRLVEVGLLQQRREGTRIYFRAERRSPIFRELRGIFEKTAGVVATLRESLRPHEEKISLAFVYGSLARAREHAGSDIDLMIIGRAGLSDLTPALRAAEKRLLREVNVTNYSVEEFRSQVRQGEHFLSNVLQKPKHFIKGSQIELEAITR